MSVQPIAHDVDDGLLIERSGGSDRHARHDTIEQPADRFSGPPGLKSAAGQTRCMSRALHIVPVAIRTQSLIRRFPGVSVGFELLQDQNGLAGVQFRTLHEGCRTRRAGRKPKHVEHIRAAARSQARQPIGQIR